MKNELVIAQAKIAILTVPAQAAQEVVDILIEAGIKAILNFAPARVIVPAGVKILNMDVVSRLARLSYYLNQPLKSSAETIKE